MPPPAASIAPRVSASNRARVVYTKNLMDRRVAAALAAALAALWIRAGEPAPAPPPAAPPSDEAMAWDRDFDLLLEESGSPTLGQLALQAELEAVEREREAVGRREADLRKRLTNITGNYALVAAAEELSRQGVTDLRLARENLQRDIAAAQKRGAELERKARDLRNRISR